MPRTIALMNQKGGVGKTTTAVNLAAGVSALGKRTLLIDLDPQAHATLHLGVEPAERGSVYDLLLDTSLKLGDVRVNARENLDVLPAETDLAGLENELSAASDRTRRLSNALDQHAAALPAGEKPYDFVFIDCPPSLGVLTLNGLSSVREVFIPMQAQFLALQGVSKLMETVKLVRATINPRLFVTGVIICAFDASTTHSKEVVADLDAFFEQSRGSIEPWANARVYRPAVRRNVKLAEAPSFGKTIIEYAPWCPGGLDYKQLAQTLVSEWDLLQGVKPDAAKPTTKPAAKTTAKTTAIPAAAPPAAPPASQPTGQPVVTVITPAEARPTEPA